MATTNGSTRKPVNKNPYGGLPDPFIMNAVQDLVSNSFLARSQFLDKYVDGRRDIDVECNYPRGEFLPINFYRMLYAREAIGERVVNLWPKECWQVQPEIYEDDDPDTETAFEKAWDALGKAPLGQSSFYNPAGGSPGGNPIFSYLLRADILSGIGTYGVILLGIDDGKLLEEPVDGAPPDGNPFLWKDRSPNPTAPLPTDYQNVESGLSGYHTSPGPFTPRTATKEDLQGTTATSATTPKDTEDEEESDEYPEVEDRNFVEARPPQIVNPSQAGPQTPGASGQAAPTETQRFAQPNTKQWGPQDELSKDIYGGMTQEQKLSSTMGTDAQYFGTQFTPTSRHDGNPINPMNPTDPMKGGGYYPEDTTTQPGQKQAQQGGTGPNYPPSDEWSPGHQGPAAQGAHKLLFLRCFDESLVQVVQYEADVRNPRFGLPIMYLIMLNDPDQPHTGVGLPLASVRVHWSRVIHLADNLRNSEIFGIPRMQPVLNRLLDLRKIYSGSAEGYWKSALPILSLETNPQLGGDVIVDQGQIDNTMYKIMNSLQRYMMLTGMSAKTLAPQLIDPGSHIDKQIEAICIEIGCPVRVFKGSERGELASSQDDSQWNDRIRHRQQAYLTPKVIVPFVDRLIMIGVLPKPKQFYVEWPDLDSQTDSQKAQILLQKTQAYAAYVAGNVESVVPPLEYMTNFGDMEEGLAQSILDAADKQQQEEQKDAQALAQQHGFQPKPPDGFQSPPTPPPNVGQSGQQPAQTSQAKDTAGGKPSNGDQGDAADTDNEPNQNRRQSNRHRLRPSNLVFHGGEGSGDFGHAGRPGEVGGSAGKEGAAGVAERKTSLIAKDMQKRATAIPFSTQVADPEDRRSSRFDPNEVEDEMTASEQAAMADHLTEMRDNAIEDAVNSYEPDYFPRDIAEGANYSLSDITEGVRELINDQVTDDAEHDRLIGELDKWDSAQSARYTYGDNGISALASSLTNVPAGLAKAIESYRRQAEEEIETATQEEEDRQRDDYHESLENDYDSDQDRIDYLRNFYDDHPERFNKDNTDVPENTWFHDSENDDWFKFTTSGGKDYLINIFDHPMVGIPAKELQFRDASGEGVNPYAVTGAGHAAEVFGKVVPAVLAYINHNNPNFITFSAAEKSRQKLYDRLVKTIAQVAGDYSAITIDESHHRYYGVIKRNQRDDLIKAIKDKAALMSRTVEPKILVNVYAAGSFDPAWFSPESWIESSIPTWTNTVIGIALKR